MPGRQRPVGGLRHTALLCCLHTRAPGSCSRSNRAVDQTPVIIASIPVSNSRTRVKRSSNNPSTSTGGSTTLESIARREELRLIRLHRRVVHRCSSRHRDGAGLAVRPDPPAAAQLVRASDPSPGGSRRGCDPAARRSRPQSHGGLDCGRSLTRRLRRSRSPLHSVRQIYQIRAARVAMRLQTRRRLRRGQLQ